MKGLLQIDGVDVGAKYNVAIVKGGLRAVMVLPSTKPPKYNDWQEEEGIEVDLSSPVLDSQEMTIPFVAVGPTAQPAAFIEMLATGGYHRFYCPKYGLSLNVRMTKVSTFTYDRYLTYFGSPANSCV